jgi:hypothetical protein
VKQFLKRLILFLGVDLLLFSLVFLIQPDRNFLYHFLEDSCIAQAHRIHHRVYEAEEQIEWLFLGSSRTMHAVQDEWINNQLFGSADSGRVSNLGYCRLGRDLHALFLREVLQNKQPKFLVLEVRYQENLYSHPVFPYLAANEDLFNWKGPVHKHLLKNLYGAWRVRLNYGYSQMVDSGGPTGSSNRGLYGYAGTNRVGDLENVIPKDPAEVKERPMSMHAFPRHHLLEIIRASEKSDVQLVFVYVPNYRNQQLPPVFSEYYQDWGELWLPPSDLLLHSANWMDDTHLNDQGAAIYSDWLLSQMITLSE